MHFHFVLRHVHHRFFLTFQTLFIVSTIKKERLPLLFPDAISKIRPGLPLELYGAAYC